MSITDYLQKTKQQIIDGYGYKDVVVDCIFSITSLKLSRDDIQKRKGILYIKAPPSAKLALLMDKQKLLIDLHQKGVKVIDFQ